MKKGDYLLITMLLITVLTIHRAGDVTGHVTSNDDLNERNKLHELNKTHTDRQTEKQTSW